MNARIAEDEGGVGGGRAQPCCRPGKNTHLIFTHKGMILQVYSYFKNELSAGFLIQILGEYCIPYTIDLVKKNEHT